MPDVIDFREPHFWTLTGCGEGWKVKKEIEGRGKREEESGAMKCCPYAQLPLSVYSVLLNNNIHIFPFFFF